MPIFDGMGSRGESRESQERAEKFRLCEERKLAAWKQLDGMVTRLLKEVGDKVYGGFLIGSSYKIFRNPKEYSWCVDHKEKSTSHQSFWNLTLQFDAEENPIRFLSAENLNPHKFSSSDISEQSLTILLRERYRYYLDLVSNGSSYSD